MASPEATLDVTIRSGAFLGGSDWLHVLSMEPYGCARQLWYKKTDAEPDFKFELTGPMKRGIALEPIIAELYKATTGRKLQRLQRRRRFGPPWLTGHPDYHINGENSMAGPGILEIKSAGGWAFKTFKREGLPDYYIMQIQHYLWLTNFRWGAFAILEPTNWLFETFEVEHDDTMIRSMNDLGEKFIRRVENGPPPDRLEAGDKRCSDCIFRTTCWGDDLVISADRKLDEDRTIKVMEDAELEQLLADRKELKSVTDDAGEALDSVNKQIKERMDALGISEVEVKGGRIYYQSAPRASLDSKLLRREMPKIAEKYTRISQVSTLKVYPT